MQDAYAIVRRADLIIAQNIMQGKTRGLAVNIQLWRADHMNRAGILAQSLYAAGGGLGADKMAIGQFGVAVAQNFINSSRNFTTFDMGAFHIVGRANQRAGERFHPVAMHQHEIRFVFHNKVRKS